MSAQELNPFAQQTSATTAQGSTYLSDEAEYQTSPQFKEDQEELCNIFPEMDPEIVEDGKTLSLTSYVQS